MDIPTWPATLPVSPLLAEYSETHSTLATSVTTGNKSILLRRNTTRAQDRLSVSFVFTRQQVEYFTTFFYDTLAGGTLRFSFTHPRTLQVIECSFDPTTDQGFTIEPAGNDTMKHYHVAFTLIIWN